jgi:hypothetical protein
MCLELYVPIGCVLILLFLLTLDEYLYRRRTKKGSTMKRRGSACGKGER